MLLGGARHQVPAIEAAKRLGYRTVLCDYLPDNPGQYAADVFYQESTTDRDKMLEVARREHIDGIISFGSDAALPSAGYVAEALGLPTNPLKSIDTLSEKYLFRPYLASHGFNCPKAVSFSAEKDGDAVLGLCDGMRFPVILKPTDSSGSKGVTVIAEPEPVRFDAAIASAREFSRNGILLCEEYIERGYPHVIGGDIFVVDGKVCFWGLMDAVRDESLGGLVPVGEAFPSGLLAPQVALLKQEVQGLVTSLELRFGEMNLEVIMGRDGRPYIIELGGRAGGNLLPQQLQDVSGVDLTEASVRCAMGEKVLDVDFDPLPGEGTPIATLVLHAKESGSFAGVDVDSTLGQYVYRRELFVGEGDRVERFVNGSKALGILFLRFPDADTMRELLVKTPQLVSIRVC
jgi:biotin carboxylase